MQKNYRVGTRASPLAVTQVEEVNKVLRAFYPKIKITTVAIDTTGDKDKSTPISDVEGSDFFTKEIDEALLKGEIDFAVHSAKDLPDKMKKGLYVTVTTKSIDPYDALVSKEGLQLKDLPNGARIGTSSERRKTALKNFRRDFKIVNIRGNIQQRLDLLKRQNLDAIVIAAAGLIRLGLQGRMIQRIPFDILKPHPLQGSLAIVIRESDKEKYEEWQGIFNRSRSG